MTDPGDSKKELSTAQTNDNVKELDAESNNVLAWAQAKESIQTLGLRRLFTDDLLKKCPVETKIALEAAERAIAAVAVNYPVLAEAIQEQVRDLRLDKLMKNAFDFAIKTGNIRKAIEVVEDEPIAVVNAAFEGLMCHFLDEYLNETAPFDEKTLLRQLTTFGRLLSAWIAKVNKEPWRIRLHVLVDEIIHRLQVETTTGNIPIAFVRIRFLLDTCDSYRVSIMNWMDRRIPAYIIELEARDPGDEEDAVSDFSRILGWCEKWGGPEDTGTPIDYFPSGDEKHGAAISYLYNSDWKELKTEWDKLKDLSPAEKRKRYEERMKKHYGFVPTPTDSSFLRKLVSERPMRLNKPAGSGDKKES